MAKVYTAQEMRAIADSDDFSAYGYDDPKYHADPDCAEIDVTQMVRGMLRQAADAIDREKKYEYGVRYFVDDGSVFEEDRHFDSLEDAKDNADVSGYDELKFVRRPVGEWEEVREDVK